MTLTTRGWLAVLAAGGGIPIADDVARLTYGQVGHHAAGRFGAKPLFDWIRTVEPDLSA